MSAKLYVKYFIRKIPYRGILLGIFMMKVASSLAVKIYQRYFLYLLDRFASNYSNSHFLSTSGVTEQSDEKCLNM